MSIHPFWSPPFLRECILKQSCLFSIICSDIAHFLASALKTPPPPPKKILYFFLKKPSLKFFLYFLKKSALLCPYKKPCPKEISCIFSKKKLFLNFGKLKAPKNFLVFWERETLRNFLYYPKKLLIFQEVTFQAHKMKTTHS